MSFFIKIGNNWASSVYFNELNGALSIGNLSNQSECGETIVEQKLKILILQKIEKSKKKLPKIVKT